MQTSLFKNALPNKHVLNGVVISTVWVVEGVRVVVPVVEVVDGVVVEVFWVEVAD